MPRERGPVLRPLLDLSRADVLRYLEELRVSFRTDSTNGDIRFLRNRVRLKLVPCLDEFFPSWRKGLLGLSETQALSAAFLAAEARRRILWEADGGSLKTGAEAFFAEPAIIREEALFLAADLLAASCRTGGGKGKAPALPRRAVLRRAVSGVLNKAADLGPVRLEREKDSLRVKPPGRECFDRGFSLLIKAPGSYRLKGGAFPPQGGLVFEVLRPEREYAGVLGKRGFFARFPLVLRSCRDGDFIFKAGQKRRLSDILKGKDLPECGVTAQDPEGCAAFIALRGGGNVLLVCRDNIKGAAVFVAVSAKGSVEISGGIDV
jgi:tRNA(Ile)-lysidine synthase